MCKTDWSNVNPKTQAADGDRWLCIPEAIKDDIFEMAHGDGHLGFHRAWQKMRGFVIHKGAKKLRVYIDQCDECKKNAVHRHKPYGSLQPILAPPIPFHTLTIDFVTGLPRTNKGFDAVAIYTCKSTKRIEGRLGIPVVWISDRDKRFVQGFWKGIFTALRTELLYKAAYNPQADGQSERSNQTGEIWLRHWQNIHQEADWDEGLAPMQASLNASVNVSTGDPPHKLMFGVDLRMPWNLLRQAFVGSPQASRQDADECAKYAAMVMKKQYDSRHKPIFFQKSDFVYLRLAQGTEPGYVWPSRNITRKLTQRHIKCRVIERVGRLAYRLQMPPELAGAHPVVSLQHLERAPQEGDLSSAEPPSTFDPRFPEDTDRAGVDAVLDMRHRGRGRGRRKQYLVRWSGVGNEHLEWLDEDNLVGAEEKVLEYLQDFLHHTQESTN
ncbi:hypothetical protein PDIP_83000 [Penicillium digitatum Pd1]|uniref:Chromo domain-containing protein n=1 Tax=Penicillium digitatum (strain Pd1 / CECT 20795) TaxID=1170230 RepID=K9FBL7_PEND1|nr:hypothetical protein PDIP_83000 [Penicillium digitatum Pd1]EKV05442.1 hypothetical protein PDIP_83000 [Penicillium digitatum Pd1]